MVIADLVLQNGKVATVDRAFSFCEAVAVKDGWIIDLGTTEEMAGHVGPETRVIDLEGRVMLPAANDAHLHATLTGLRMGEGPLDVGATQSLADLKAMVAGAAKAAKPGQWIWGSGFMEFLYPELQAQGMRGVNRWDLDEAAPDRSRRGSACIIRLFSGSPRHRLLDPRQIFCSSAAAISPSRKSGWAMAISFSARSQVERPDRRATPYSVTRLGAWVRGVVMTSPSVNLGRIRECMTPCLSVKVEDMAKNAWPWSAI